MMIFIWILFLKDQYIWYRRQAIGVNTLATTVKRLCQKAGIKGHKMKHTLSVTAATRLFQNGKDERLIMTRTGHRSIDELELISDHAISSK